MYCIRYDIIKGDTLYGISRRFCVPINAIMDANPLVNIYSLTDGDTIDIPVIASGKQYTNYTTYLIDEENTLGSILEKNHINLSDLLELNALSDIYLAPGSTLKVPIFPGEKSGVTL